MSEIFYSWKFDDSRNRGSMWYIIALSIVIGLAIWGFFTKQYGMSFIVLLIAGLTFFVYNNSDDEVEVSITKIGLNIGLSFYDYNSINSFSIIYNGKNAVFLRLHLKKKGLRYIDLQINNNISENIVTILPEYINQGEKNKLTFIEKIIQILKL